MRERKTLLELEQKTAGAYWWDSKVLLALSPHSPINVQH